MIYDFPFSYVLKALCFVKIQLFDFFPIILFERLNIIYLYNFFLFSLFFYFQKAIVFSYITVSVIERVHQKWKWSV